MAFKKYAYYNKGNKIALVEQSDSTSSGFLSVAHCTISGYTTKDTCEAAGGQWIPSSSGGIDTVGEYKSPAGDVAHGLEVEYTYVPSFNKLTPSGGIIGDNVSTGNLFHIFGYGSVGGYLSFYANMEHDSQIDFGHSNLDLEIGTEGTDYILIEGSGRWDGLHKIKDRSAYGYIQTNTLFREVGVASINTGDVVAAAGTIDDDGSGEIAFLFPSTSDTYYFALTPDIGDNNSIYQGTSDGASTLTISSGWTYYTTSSSADRHGKYTEETTLASLSLSDETDVAAMNVHKIYKDECILYCKDHFETMQDESFELDLTRYQANAVVYYLQAKKFEDAGDLKGHEYYMRKFKKQLEKGSEARKYGPHMIQGHWNMRK